jgi:hypothetical protein
MPKRSTSQHVPKDMQARFEEITHLTDAFCRTYLAEGDPRGSPPSRIDSLPPREDLNGPVSRSLCLPGAPVLHSGKKNQINP